MSKPKIQIYKDESCEMMKVVDGVKHMEGNFWDFDNCYWECLVSQLADVEDLEYKYK